MFEKIIESTKSKLLSYTDLQEEYLKADDLLNNPDISEENKTYFRAAIDWWIYEERLIREANVNFASENSEIQTIYDQLDAAYKSAAKLDSDDLNLLFSSVTETRLNFLIRPRTTLKWFVFRGEPTKSHGEIIKRLNYIADYPYLIDRLKEIYKNKAAQNDGETVASVYEFEQQTEKIDKDSIYNLAPDQFTDLCEPMFGFFSENSEESGSGEIPVEALIVFLDDKGLADVGAHLEEKCLEENLQFISKDYFLEFINNILSENASDSSSEIEDADSSPDVPETIVSSSQGSSAGTKKLFKKILDAFETVAFPDSASSNPNPISDNFISDEEPIQDSMLEDVEDDTASEIEDVSDDTVNQETEPEIVESEEEILAVDEVSDIQVGDSEEETLVDDEKVDFEVPPDEETDILEDNKENDDDTPVPDEFPNESYLESSTEPDLEIIDEESKVNTELNPEIVDELLDAVDVSLEVVEEETDFNEFEASDFEELEETVETDSEQDELSEDTEDVEIPVSDELSAESFDDIIPEETPEDVAKEIPDNISVDIADDVTEEITEEVEEGILDDVAEEIPDNIPEDIIDDTSEEPTDEIEIPTDFETVADEPDAAGDPEISEEETMPDITDEPIPEEIQVEVAAAITDSSELTEDEAIDDISKNFNDEIDEIIANMDKLTYGDSVPPEEAEHSSTLLSEIENDDSVNFDNEISEDMLKENYFEKEKDSE